MSAEEVPVRHLSKLLRTENQLKIDGILGGIFHHPKFGPLRITAWEPGSRNTIRLTTADIHNVSRTLSTQFFQELSIRLTSGSAAQGLIEACAEFREYESQESLRVQREQEAILRVEAETETYANSLKEIAGSYRIEVLSRFPDALRESYSFSTHTLVQLAVEWFGASPPSPPPHVVVRPEVEPFLMRTTTLWESSDPWDRMRLIRHFTDHSHFVAALKLSFALERENGNERLARAIRV